MVAMVTGIEFFSYLPSNRAEMSLKCGKMRHFELIIFNNYM